MKRDASRDLLGFVIKELDQKFYSMTPLDTSGPCSSKNIVKEHFEDYKSYEYESYHMTVFPTLKMVEYWINIMNTDFE